MLKLFSRYFSVGIVNTLIHWVVFIIFIKIIGIQSVSNLIGFAVAVTFSFFVNAKFTFKKSATKTRYFLFVAFMGMISFTFGFIADYLLLAPIITLVAFSGTSLILGFIYSRYVVFKDL